MADGTTPIVDPNTQPPTLANVRAIAHHLNAMPDASLQLFINDAYFEVTTTTGAKPIYYEILTRWLAAHNASLDYRQANVEHVGPMSREYNLSRTAGETGKGGIQSTPYGLKYDQLMKRLTGRGRLNLAVY